MFCGWLQNCRDNFVFDILVAILFFLCRSWAGLIYKVLSGNCTNVALSIFCYFLGVYQTPFISFTAVDFTFAFLSCKKSSSLLYSSLVYLFLNYASFYRCDHVSIRLRIEIISLPSPTTFSRLKMYSVGPL